MEVVQVVVITLFAYAVFVAVVEALIGFVQPEMEGGVTLTQVDARGGTGARKLACLRLDGRLYIASNHWLRGWYRRALAEPHVRVEVDGVEGRYRAVPIEGEERARVSEAYRMGFVLRFFCGFAPSRFLRLDPE